MHKILLIFIFITGSHFASFAQQKEFEYEDPALLNQDSALSIVNDDDAEVDEDYELIVPDTTLIARMVNVPSDSIRYLKNKQAFSYIRNIDSLLRIRQSDGIEMSPNTESVSMFERLFNAPLLKIIFWLIAGIFIIFIAVRLLITHGVFSRTSSSKLVEELPEEAGMNVHSDYNKLIHQSCLLGDYRSAVKYLFLRTLQVMSDHSYIEYAADKTNYVYLQEIAADKKNAFSRLILNYEYIWYGKMPVEREMYEKLEKEYNDFQNEIVYR